MVRFDLIVEKDLRESQRGSAMAIALFVLALVGVFVALAVTRSASEAAAVGNESGEGRTTYAAQGSLEMMTRNFNKIFEIRLNPTTTDITDVEGAGVPGLSGTGNNFTFAQEVDQTSTSTPVVLSGGPFSGLYAIRDYWRLRTTATDPNGIQVQLSRNILNNRVPIFQFGVFYEDDLELFNGPTFGFGGRVHSNRHFFLHPSDNGAYFDSRVTAVGHIVTQSKKNGDTVNITSALTQIKNASGVYKQLAPDKGSVLNGTPNEFGTGMPWADASLPASKLNPGWASQSAIFDGNLQAGVKRLKLPINVGANTDLIEMIRRGKKAPSGSDGGDLYNNSGTLSPVTTATQDNAIMMAERFANKPGIRISLADSKEKLPGCATGTGTAAVTTACGVRLDGAINGQGAIPSPTPSATPERTRGYQPRAMKNVSSDTTFNYYPTRANGERFHTGGSREVWIKVETVTIDPVSDIVTTKDITEDFLSMGITEQAPSLSGFSITGYDHTAPGSSLTATSAQTASIGTDSRAVIKLQRFLIPGPAIPGGSNLLTSYASGSYLYNVVMRYSSSDWSEVQARCDSGCTAEDGDPNSSVERYGHLKHASVGGNAHRAIVPFPIEMFDTREGLYYDDRSATYYSNASFDNPSGTPRKIARNGVMSMVDIDVANLRRFLRGDFNGLFPTDTPFATAKGGSLVNTDIPERGGWVLYVSDRRGDADFDGEFDMEDIYGAAPGNDGILQPGEDLQVNGAFGFGILNTAYGTEADRYADNAQYPDAAAVNDHKYYRRGVRLINGEVLPGIYDSATASNTKGFTVSSENGVYVKGNYNATGVSSVPGTGNTPYNHYLPFNSATHIPAAIVADAVTILSTSKYDQTTAGAAVSGYTDGWNDAKSFVYPYTHTNRIAITTQIRFAMISGDTITSKEATPNQGGTDPRLNGGLHNFKRFLEDWGGDRLDYTGSLINLYNSKNNNGSFKCCNTVYSPPRRNWVFDSTFLDPSRIPPGTPYFQYVQTTGFQRTND